MNVQDPVVEAGLLSGQRRKRSRAVNLPAVKDPALFRTVQQLRQQAAQTIALCDELEAALASASQEQSREPEQPMLLDGKQVAALLGISATTLWRYKRDKVIPAPITIGSLERWRRVDIENYVDAHTQVA